MVIIKTINQLPFIAVLDVLNSPYDKNNINDILLITKYM
jgi:hypothetical protein